MHCIICVRETFYKVSMVPVKLPVIMLLVKWLFCLLLLRSAPFTQGDTAQLTWISVSAAA